MAAAGARLEVVAGKAAGMTILVDDELIIGRLSEGAGRLADDEELSRSHARVTFDAGGLCSIEDMGSTNGTFVNGLRVSAPQSLARGDMVELGATTLVVRELPQPETLSPEPGAPQPTVGSRVVPPPPAEPAAAGVSPAPPPDAAEVRVPPALSLRLEVDFVAHQARIMLQDGAEPLRLVFDDGAWRPASSPANEKGSA